jgi:tRNA (cmo5U34)-methyltransferase
MTQWTFNSHISQIFNQHAKQHIPDYERVIEKSVKLCRKFLTDSDKIIDVGCAIGETIKCLYMNGFTNLVGVDSSEPMLEKAKKFEIAEWLLSDEFPSQHHYSAVICNWTLHFIKDKESYLSDIYSSLNKNGFLILTDKTCNEGLELELYHDFKREQGVSEQEILIKAASVKNVMFINDPDWYVKTLTDIGFTNITIINKAPCFTTFLAVKL